MLRRQSGNREVMQAAFGRADSRSRRLAVEFLESRQLLSSDSGQTPAIDDLVEPNDLANLAIVRAHRVALQRDMPAAAGANLLRAGMHRRERNPSDLERRAVIAPAFGPPVRSFSPRGDFNGDGPVDRADLAALARNYGLAADAAFADGDLNGDRIVDLADLAGMVFGPGPFQVVVPLSATADPTPDISWTASVGAASYYVTIEHAPGCGGEAIAQTFANVAATSLELAPLAHGTYYVCATAKDAAGNGAHATNRGQLFVVSPLTGDLVGDVVVHPVNHASFVMSWSGKIIYVDPVGGASAFAGLPRADLILVTHIHGDHFSSSTIAAVGNTNPDDAIADVRIVAPQAVYNGLSVAQRNVATVLANDANVNVLGLNVAAVPAYNTNHARGTGNGYVVTLGEQRIYISGDTGAVPEIRALDDIDAAFVCMNAPTMTVAEAASVVRDMQPRVVYPYHYRSGSTFSDLGSFSAQVGTDLGIEVRLRPWY